MVDLTWSDRRGLTLGNSDGWLILGDDHRCDGQPYPRKLVTLGNYLGP